MATSKIKDTIKKVMPAVVSIVISKSLEEIEKEMSHEFYGHIPLGGLPEIPEEAVDSHGMVKIGGGSGFVVHENGVIITNKHVVVDPNSEYTVLLNDGRKLKASVLARDPVEDIAILKVSAAGLPTVKLGDSSDLELGEEILAIGNALGLFRNTVSSGIVSGLSRSIRASADPRSPIQEMRGLIQTDAPINPGNSGGPLVNLKGEAIGINAAIVYGAQNLSFALPINSAKRDLHDLEKFGRIKRPLLGLRYVVVDENMKDKLKLKFGYGVMVMGHGPKREGVMPETPAAKAGLKEKDHIIECNGEKLTEEKTLQDFLENMNVGDVMNLKFVRKGKEMEAEVTLAERK
jgi:S1-C subfamily serine protease